MSNIEVSVGTQLVGSEDEIPSLLPAKLIFDERGTLGVLEGGSSIGFEIRRFYFLTDFPDGAERGAHAHRRLRQCLICLRGQVSVELIGANRRYLFELSSNASCLLIPPGYWRILKSGSADTLVGVLASEHYDESDYIRDFDEFLQWARREPDEPKVPYIALERYLDSKRVGELADRLRAGVVAQAASGQYIGGQEVENFEASFSRYCETTFTVGVANGLDALQLALMQEGISGGDEVIVPSHTFVATALAVTLAGATPVPVDVDDEVGLIDPEKVADAITPRTRAIIPVHLYGHPADMDPLRDIARRYGLLLVEDAAQAHGARYKGKRCGSLGDVAAFSFYPTKNLGAMGDAGALTTNDCGRASSLRAMANYGARRRYHHETLGMNSRLDPIQATVLAKKLAWLDEWNRRRREHAACYIRELSGIDGLRLPVVKPWAEPVWHVFAVRVSDGRRDELQSFLSRNDIGSNIHYPLPVHGQACYANMGWRAADYPVAERTTREVLSLPLDPLHSEREIERVIDVVRRFFEQPQ